MESVKNAAEKSKTRLENLSDGLFAIVFTILVLELVIRNVHFADEKAFHHYLLDLWPKLLSYLFSFAILATYWIGHVEQFYFVDHINRRFVFTNILFLFFISLIPFSASLIGEFREFPLSARIYGVNLLCCQVAFYLNWRILVRDHLHTALLHEHGIRQHQRCILIGLILDPIGIAMTYISTTAGLLLLALVPTIYLALFLLDKRPLGQVYLKK